MRGGPGTAVQPLENAPSAQTTGGDLRGGVFGVTVALRLARGVPRKVANPPPPVTAPPCRKRLYLLSSKLDQVENWIRFSIQH